MAGGEIVKLLLILSYAAGVGADDGDDFSNNLFSDLAPLLALFGERVTMQFMSQSMGWADNLILAMAPLGIITIIVSAIRVGGPSWLKAIDGRARENLAIAETELMSSTSNEVCELWNGRQVVRCMGSAPITEFICVLPTAVEKDWNPEIRTIYRDSDEKNECLKPTSELFYLAIPEPIGSALVPGLNFWNNLARWRTSQKAASHRADTEKSPTRSSSSDIVILRNRATVAPNVSLNSHNQFWRGELRVAAVFGIIIQLGVLMYSGFATYHPALKLTKGGGPIMDYAYPCTAAGTLFLVTGMLICGHVVESSTDEEKYEAGEGKRVRIIWLQQTKTVSDQLFDSYAMYAKDDRALVTISRRAIKGTALDSSIDDRKDASGHQDRTRVLLFQTVLGTMISLCGFVVQFIGLRGMHWSASVSQLGAVVVMTCIRALVRRGLAKSLASERLTSGYELEWFALTLGDPCKAPWLHSESEQSNTKVHDWRILTGKTGPIRNTEDQGDASQLRQVFDGANPRSKAHQVMEIRKRLGWLADWHGPATTEAVSLARAIEATTDALNVLLERGNGPKAYLETRNWEWSLDACYSDCHAQKTWFRVERSGGRWKANANELEAALSLWLYSVKTKDEASGHSLVTEPFRAKDKSDDDSRLRATEPSAKPKLRILGRRHPALVRDLRWWLPKDTSSILEVGEHGPGDAEVDDDEIVDGGRLHLKGKGRLSIVDTISDSARKGTASADHREEVLLAAKSSDSLLSLYAQDMFTSFMWAVAKQLKSPIQGGAEIRPDDSSNGGSDFTLRNTQLSRMAQDIQSTGLGSLDQVYYSIIPPLSQCHRLPQANAIIELAREQAKPHEALGRWSEAGQIYLWLMKQAKTFPEDTEIFAHSTAVLVDVYRQVVSIINLRKDQEDDRGLEQLQDLRLKLEKALEGTDQGFLLSLMELYAQQNREWNCDLIKDKKFHVRRARYPKVSNTADIHDDPAVSDDNGDFHKMAVTGSISERLNVGDIHGWTELHYRASNRRKAPFARHMRRKPDVNTYDLNGWTPLHYACQVEDDYMEHHNKGRHNKERYTNVVRDLLRAGADINAQGRDRVAPLHCAAMAGRCQTVEILVEDGASIDILDASGNTPLLWAVYKGHQRIVEYLWDVTNKRLRDGSGRTALHVAALAGHDRLVEWLVNDKKADVNAKDHSMRSPLHLAVIKGNEAVVTLLTNSELEAEDKDGTTPFLLAIKFGHLDIANILLEKGARLENSRGPLLLHLAILNGQKDSVDFLIEKGVDVEGKCSFQRTPLHVAAISDNEAIVEVLINNHVNIDAKDGLGKTPLMGAINRRYFRVAEMLINAGADKSNGWRQIEDVKRYRNNEEIEAMRKFLL
ncbi:ankyrin repeat [Fusarium albosuccineum]|uniref:Ankyrin repeat n=1 Tax=Fusarium albosuccineum TaxID=1237068 RepID=A0A8H4LGY2_9HYPO|nr:ankyrin repeat [Fusarium albosuccineum]